MPVGTLELPPETHLGAVGDGRVLVVTRDTLDVRRVSVHRVVDAVAGG
jgi:hypothetical protein